MSLAILDRQLQLIRLLAMNRHYTVDEIAARVEMGRRQIYRYIKEFNQAGFDIESRGSVHRILPSSPFVRDLTDYAYLSPAEAMLVYQMLSVLPSPTARVRAVKGKLMHAFSNRDVPQDDMDMMAGQNLQNILMAMERGRQVILHNYRSVNSATVSDRLVEPFALVNGNADVRCYEVASHQTKSFRLTRAESIIIQPTLWQYQQEHILPETDPFGYYAHEAKPVTLQMTTEAFQLYCEEIDPHPQYEQRGDGCVDVHTSYCHPAGISRFILGLMGEVEVVDDENLREHLQQQVQKFIK